MPRPDEPGFPRGFEEHRLEQILHVARHTTAEQRFDWVEESLELFGPFSKGTVARNPWKAQNLGKSKERP